VRLSARFAAVKTAMADRPPDRDRGPTEAVADPSVRPVLQTLQAALDAREHPKAFSDPALARLFERQTEFVQELGLEAIRLAQRAREDVVSASDVDRADERIRAEGRGRGRASLEALGGISAGGGLGLFIQTVAETNPGTLGFVIGTVLLVIGAVTLTLGLFGSRPGRR
jgi:F0F1-type ATP synthase assembly protein I